MRNTDNKGFLRFLLCFGVTALTLFACILSYCDARNIIDGKSTTKYELITTDIYGSENATGILINLSGEVIGIINQKHNKDDLKNLISAFGISQLKQTIERMSNGREEAYLGITGTDVTNEANQTLGVPLGAYVTGIIMDSPAMKAGIQSGDIITQINEIDIQSFSEFMDMIMGMNPNDNVNIVIKRQGKDEYREISIPIVLEKIK